MPAKIISRASESDKHPADISSLICHRGLIFSADDDGNVMVWSDDLNKLAEVTAHTEAVNSLAAIGDTIYSCSNDGTVKAWSMGLKELATIANEDCKFWKLTANDNLLYAGNNKGLVYVFENNTLKSKLDIQDGIKDMVVSENNVVSVKDMQIFVTEIMKGDKCLKRKNLPGNAPLCLIDNKLLFVSGNGTNIAVHENSAKLNYEQVTCFKDAHRMIINGIVGAKSNDETFIYSAGWDKAIKQWKLSGSNLELDMHCVAGYVVNALATSEAGIVFAGGEDGSLVRVLFS